MVNTDQPARSAAPAVFNSAVCPHGNASTCTLGRVLADMPLQSNVFAVDNAQAPDSGL
jgi:hypothetical protein